MIQSMANLFSIVVILTVLNSSASGAPSVQFSFGTVEGYDVVSPSLSKPAYVYYGIPFAEPPVGDLRFRPPVPFRGNNPATVISSNTYRPACIQNDEEYAMNEDCLYLNIFTPASNSVVPQKVLFWIHGGGYTFGSAFDYEPLDMVTEYDVIVVTTQYRLGPLGFLSSKDKAQPGNNGLRDQLLALRWVKDNIARFNGDANDVTIFGESAGASSVSFLSLSPLSKGLFTKAIMQSGTALSRWGFPNAADALGVLYTLADQTGCKPWFYVPGRSETYHQTIVDCLRTQPLEKLNYPGPLGSLDGKSIPPFSSLANQGPTVDGDVVPMDPLTMLNNKTYLQEIGALDRQYLAGITNNEGMIYLDILTMFSALGDRSASLAAIKNPSLFEPWIKSETQAVSPLGLSQSAFDLVRFMYSYPRDNNGTPNIQELLNVVTDLHFLLPTLQFCDAMSQSSKTPVYLYLFDHYPEPANGNTELFGTNHGIDLAYLFDRFDAREGFIGYQNIYSSRSLPMFDVYRSAVTSFAKNGNPSWNAVPDWPRYNRKTESYAVLDVAPSVKQKLYAKRVALWRDYFSNLRSSYFSRNW